MARKGQRAYGKNGGKGRAGGAGKAGAGKAREKEEREAITYAFVHFFAGRYLFVKKLRLY